VGLEKAVVDVGTEGVQRNASLAVPLVARHLTATESATAGNTDAFGAKLERGLHGLFHGATKRYAANELHGDVFGDQLRVRFGFAHLVDVDEHLDGSAFVLRYAVAIFALRLGLLGPLENGFDRPIAAAPLEAPLAPLLFDKLFAQRLDARSLFADDRPGTGRVDTELNLVDGTFDPDAADAGGLEFLADKRAHADVLVQAQGVAFVLKPLGIPGVEVAQPKATGVGFLSHNANSTSRRHARP